jgi:hypothetical protein
LAVGNDPGKDKRWRFCVGADPARVKAGRSGNFGPAMHQGVRERGKATGFLDPASRNNFVTIGI